MKDDILNDLLNDVFKELEVLKNKSNGLDVLLKEILTLQKSKENNVITEIKLLLSENSIKEKITTKPQEIDAELKKFTNYFSNNLESSIRDLRFLANKIPTEINSTTLIEKNIVLFSNRYDEGHYGFKQLLNGFYLLIGFCFITFLGFKYYPIYFKSKDENLPYKQTLDYYYYKADKKNRAIIIKTVDHFRQGDTLYINDLNRIKNNFYNNEND